MCREDPFAPLVIFPGQGGAPLRLEVSVTPSDEVQRLRQDAADLRRQLDDLQARYNRVEYLYRCETLINFQLADLCKENGVKVPRRLYDRPDSVAQATRGDAGA